MDDVRAGILVLDFHENNFVNFVRLFSSREQAITVFTDREYRKSVSDGIEGVDCINWELKRDSEDTKAYLERVETLCNSAIDVLILFPFYGHLYDIFDRIQFSPSCKTLQIVYNANLWTMSNLRWTRQLKLYAEPLLRRWLLSQMDAALVEYTSIAEHVRRQADTNVHAFTPLLTDMTGTAGEEEDCPGGNAENKHVISIPGHIDPQRRNYGIVLNALTEHLSDRADDLRIQLLGSPSDESSREIVRRCENLVADGWDIDYFSDWIPVPEFDRKLRKSDVIVSPMRRTKQHSVVTEQYGVSKSSGCFLDAVRFAVPLILPAHHRVPEETAPFVRQYESATDLANLIWNVVANDDLSDDVRAYVTDRYTPKAQHHRFTRILKKVCEN